MRVTSKGQVTIPLHVRKRLGIEPGSEVDFTIDGDTVRLLRHDGADGAAVVAQMRGRARGRLSTAEIMRLTRGDG